MRRVWGGGERSRTPTWRHASKLASVIFAISLYMYPGVGELSEVVALAIIEESIVPCSRRGTASAVT